MKVVLLGATDLSLRAAEVLDAIPEVELLACVNAGPTIRISYAPQGRANVRHTDLAEWCAARDTTFHRFTDNPTLAEAAAGWDADMAVVAGWYHLVPRSVRSCFRLGAVGLHASLLPAFRGGAPLNWAILSGAEETGISLFVLTDGVDEGPLYGQSSVPIGPRTNVGELVAATTGAGMDLLAGCLPAIARGEAEPYAQTGEPSYTLHREPDDGRIDWSWPAERIDRLVRAVTHPYPGAFTLLGGQEVVIWDGEPVHDAPAVWSEPGGIIRLPGFDAPMVATGDGLLAILAASDRCGNDLMGPLLKSSYKRFGS